MLALSTTQGEPDSEPEIIEVDIPRRGTEEWEIVTEQWEKPVIELMEAADELWGKSAVVYTLQWLIRERINASESVPSLMLIPIDELMRELELMREFDSFVTSFVPRAAVNLILSEVAGHPAILSQVTRIFRPLELHVIYSDFILQIITGAGGYASLLWPD
jgi:hypothetical protein